MSYQVLARKWRPRNFAEMVGQEHVLRALINALDNDRLHHAFLFTGTRGVGKTTVSRILAKSLNCESGITSQPCGTCSVCREIDEGRFVDLIEVDAASRTKVEDTRELLENVQYAPSRGRYKVYLIDEVHMLSTHSFNALLKTLEEPPPHVKFLLATTDPQKLPVTILSRCLQFNLKRLTVPMIGGHLKTILDKESVTYDEAAIQLLARGADGSMRDGLSLLDQAIAFGGGRVGEGDTRLMLGTIEQDHIFALLEALADGDAGALLERVARLTEQAPDYAGALADLLVLLHQVALAQIAPDAVDENLTDRERVLSLAARMPAEEVQLCYQIGLHGRRDLPLAPDPRGGLEMSLLRMLAFRPAAAEGSHAAPSRPAPAARPAPAPGSVTAPAPRPAPAAPARPEESAPPAAHTGSGGFDSAPPRPAPEAAPARASAPPPPPPVGTAGGEEWPAIVAQLGLKGMAHQLAVNCSLLGREGSIVRLALDPNMAQLKSGSAEARLGEALGRYYGGAVRLEIGAGGAVGETPAQRQARGEAERQREAERVIGDDPDVRAFQEQLGARVRPGSIHPLDD